MSTDVFVSYSSKDKLVADDICVNLEAAGIHCWIAPRDIAPGEDWPTAITKAIPQNRVMILVFSANSNSSEDVGRELILAANSKLVIVPFRIEDIEPEPGKQYYLARTHWLDASNPPTQEQIGALLDCVKGLVPVSEPSPVFEAQPTPAPYMDRPIPGNKPLQPQLRTLNRYSNNLPVQLTSFIGREKEMAEIKQAMDEHRLVTLTGSGGVGKTRLALQVAADLLDQFPDGVWFVELAPLSNPDLIPQTILSALDISEQKGRSPLEVLEEYLARKNLLIVLDNCEHLIEASAKTVHAILNAAPNVKILASSREALGVKGELSWSVPSLSLPDPKESHEPEQLAQYEAVRLFIDRAALVVSHFALNKENAHAIAQICFRLDGIPLAIELAAARVNVLSLEQIATRLDHLFRLLTGGARTALPRQQTLRATVDWSYDLLSDLEKTLFRRLAVFAGGSTLEAAERVCSGDGIETDQVLELISQLVRKSLVIAQNVRGETRYRTLETIRQYAREKLFESGEGEKVRDAHLHAMVTLAEEAEPEVRGHDQVLWLDRLDAEMDNLRAALEWSQERDKESCLRLASALWRFLDIRGHVEDLEWLPKALALTEGSKTVTRARALARAGYVANNYSDLKRAEKWSQEAATLGRELGDKAALAMALLVESIVQLDHYSARSTLALLEQALTLSKEIKDHWLVGMLQVQCGYEALSRNDLKSARSFADEGLKEARIAGDKRGINFGFAILADIALVQGDAERAQRLSEERLTNAQEIGDRASIINCYWYFTFIALFLKDCQYAEQSALEACKLAQELNDKGVISNSLGWLGWVYWAQGDLSRSTERTEEALVIAKQINDPWLVADALRNLGECSRLKGDFIQAKIRFTEALTIYQEEHIEAGSCTCLESFGMLAIDQGQAERGARLLSARETLRASVHVWDFYPFMVDERERHIATARAQLGEEAFNKAWAEGAAMSTEEAIQYALET